MWALSWRGGGGRIPPGDALYPVFQRWTGHSPVRGRTAGGAAPGAFIGRDTKTATQINGGESAESAGLEVNVSIEWTQRLESVTVQQYSGAGPPGRTPSPPREAMAGRDLVLPWAEGAAYTLAVKRYWLKGRRSLRCSRSPKREITPPPSPSGFWMSGAWASR